jgi:hypothetical protein
MDDLTLAEQGLPLIYFRSNRAHLCRWEREKTLATLSTYSDSDDDNNVEDDGDDNDDDDDDDEEEEEEEEEEVEEKKEDNDDFYGDSGLENNETDEDEEEEGNDEELMKSVLGIDEQDDLFEAAGCMLRLVMWPTEELWSAVDALYRNVALEESANADLTSNKKSKKSKKSNKKSKKNKNKRKTNTIDTDILEE